LPATFQFSPATSKSIDIPGLYNDNTGGAYCLNNFNIYRALSFVR